MILDVFRGIRVDRLIQEKNSPSHFCFVFFSAVKSFDIWWKHLILRHTRTTTFICAITQVVAFSTPVRQHNYSYSNYPSVPLSTPFTSSHNFHLSRTFHTSSLSQKMSSSSSTTPPYHDEIVKAMAAAAEMRERSSNNEDMNDTDPLTIFDKIIAGDIPCNKVYEDDVALAFHDVNPVAPIHILVIPKVRDGLVQISKATTHDHQTTLGHLMMVASQIGKQYCSQNGFRIVINDGEHGGQSVYHLHIHVIGGRQMQWPPG
jgi:histidine triad (HIT) family protein